jgi:hypothetical protein
MSESFVFFMNKSKKRIVFHRKKRNVDIPTVISYQQIQLLRYAISSLAELVASSTFRHGLSVLKNS